MSITSSDILRQYNLSHTACREEVLAVLLEAGSPLTEDEIKRRIGGKFDRTTFYRTFKTLVSRNILHKIPVDADTFQYALHASDSLSESHAHFYCRRCHRVVSTSAIQAGSFPVPSGFRADETEIVVKGLCNECNN